MSEILNYLRDLAQAPEKASKKSAKFVEERYPSVKKVTDLVQEVAETPGADFMVPGVAMTRAEGMRPVLNKLFEKTGMRGPMLEDRRKALADTLRIIGVIPKRVWTNLRDFHFDPYNEFRFTDPNKYQGTFSWNLPYFMEQKKPLMPGREPSKIIIQAYPMTRANYTPADVLAHEAGHGAATDILKKLKGSSQLKASVYDTIEQGEWEGIAEYLREAMEKKAGTPSTPSIFPYGKLQQKGYEEMKQMPSKNPYMNVYRYLQGLMRSK